MAPEAQAAEAAQGSGGAIETPPVAKAKVGKAQADLPEKVQKDWQIGEKCWKNWRTTGENMEKHIIWAICGDSFGCSK